MANLEAFSFEHTLELDEKLYVEMRGLSRRYAPLRRIAGVLIGVGCLFWSYTLLLGLVLLSLVALSAVMPRLVPGNSAQVFKQYSPHLHEPILYGLSESELWARSERFNQTSSWENLAVWELKSDWLRLQPHGSVELYFRVEALRDLGVLDRVLELARRHGTEFDRPKQHAA